ncbi:helix-turn-helix domain-containing protein [Streptomyces sp. NPDC058525]|uniref:helix-turn-helix domain-containing protein n=1 Tax=Streptomyces sp. NPDC058525 TaxID=3346538 RepID=UPI00365636A2
MAPAVSAALAEAAARGSRMVSICLGAFALAAAGLLDGRRATTHWQYAAALAQQYPRVTVQAEALYIDLPIAPDPDDEPAPVYEWALRNLHQPLTVDQLARHAGMSRRTLIRRFHADTGRPPMRWLLDARLGLARELLEASDLTVEAVARRCGLGTPANFRTLFKANVGVPPRAYQERSTRPRRARRETSRAGRVARILRQVSRTQLPGPDPGRLACAHGLLARPPDRPLGRSRRLHGARLRHHLRLQPQRAQLPFRAAAGPARRMSGRRRVRP